MLDPQTAVVVLQCNACNLFVCRRNALSPIASPKKWPSPPPRVPEFRALGGAYLCVRSRPVLRLRSRTRNRQWHRFHGECRRGDAPGGRHVPLPDDPRHDPRGPARLQGSAGHEAFPEFRVSNPRLHGQDVSDVFFPALSEFGSDSPFQSPNGQGDRDLRLFQKVARRLRKGDLHAGPVDGRELRHLVGVLEAKGLEDCLAFGLGSEPVLLGEPQEVLCLSQFRLGEIGILVRRSRGDVSE